jgi:hypothetical protein
VILSEDGFPEPFFASAAAVMGGFVFADGAAPVGAQMPCCARKAPAAATQ